MRGFGNVQATYAWESHLDNVADGLGVDPAELRLKNYTEKGDVSLHGWKIASCAVADATRYVVDKIDWKAKRAPGRKRPWRRSCELHPCFGKQRVFPSNWDPMAPDPSSGVVRVDEEGKSRNMVGRVGFGPGRHERDGLYRL